MTTLEPNYQNANMGFPNKYQSFDIKIPDLEPVVQCRDGKKHDILLKGAVIGWLQFDHAKDMYVAMVSFSGRNKMLRRATPFGIRSHLLSFINDVSI